MEGILQDDPAVPLLAKGGEWAVPRRVQPLRISSLLATFIPAPPPSSFVWDDYCSVQRPLSGSQSGMFFPLDDSSGKDEPVSKPIFFGDVT